MSRHPDVWYSPGRSQRAVLRLVKSLSSTICVGCKSDCQLMAFYRASAVCMVFGGNSVGPLEAEWIFGRAGL